MFLQRPVDRDTAATEVERPPFGTAGIDLFGH